MEENKKAIIGTVVTVLVLAGAGGFYYWKSNHKTVAKVDATTASASVGQIDGSNIPLNSAGAASDSGGLSVSSGSATGQLGAGGQSGTQGQSGSRSSGGGSQGLDPSSFAQYDKYKTEQHALFGDIKVGDGEALAAGKQAAVYYKGWLTNGQMFDQSRTDSSGNMQPFMFTEGSHQVIPGWEEAMLGMKVGGTRLLIVPPAVGYGANGQGPIPGNSVLVFQVQLIAVQ